MNTGGNPYPPNSAYGGYAGPYGGSGQQPGGGGYGGQQPGGGGYGGQQPGGGGYGGQQPGGGGYGGQQPPAHYGQQPGAPGGSGAPGFNGPEPVGEGEMPMDNGDNEGSSSEAVPSAPPMQDMEKIPGYENILSPNVTFVAPPPTYQEATSGASIENIASSAKLSEEEARQLLVSMAKDKCCWGKGAAEGMQFRSLQQSTAVHYTLRTYVETRATDWTSEPYTGQMVDGPHNGAAPAPWDIHIQTPDMFHDTTLKCEVPHTASVRTCHGCHGSTMIMCHRCMGWGRTRCIWCHGSGIKGFGENRSTCTSCHGSGRRLCYHCHGRGRLRCPTCHATGQVKCFVQMTVMFQTHEQDFILERTSLPDHLIRDVEGKTLFEDTQPLLNPIQGFPEQQVNTQSAQIIHQHRGYSQTGRIWMQKHEIRGVPVFQCDCQWKDKELQFFVYGDDRRVHCENYPQTCCCGCQIL